MYSRTRSFYFSKSSVIYHLYGTKHLWHRVFSLVADRRRRLLSITFLSYLTPKTNKSHAFLENNIDITC